MSTNATKLSLERFDPLADDGEIQRSVVEAARRREIRNILKSYTGLFDFLSEPIQNALDAIDERCVSDGPSYKPKLWVTIDLTDQSVRVTDNGIGFTSDQFRSFLKPNVSYKGRKGTRSRGNKGVGATYLAYGFNFLAIATTSPDFYASVVLKNGREWVEDQEGIVPSPTFELTTAEDDAFASVDRGSSFVLRLVGPGIRPSDMGWLQARTAEQWAAILCAKTPLGRVYLPYKPPPIEVRVIVRDKDSTRSEVLLTNPVYLYPHQIPGLRVQRLGDILSAEIAVVGLGKTADKVSGKFKRLHGIFETWSPEQILAGDSTLRIDKLQPEERTLIDRYHVAVYGYFCYSTSVWDGYNDNTLKLRRGMRLLKGGLQMAANTMPQGEQIVIPLLSHIGYQQTTHVVVHLEDADPDLGRKGFQPEIVLLAEKLSVGVTNVFRRRKDNLLPSPGAPKFTEDQKKYEWIRAQEGHEEKFPLTVESKFLSIRPSIVVRSLPQSEQDVIALFNQFLSSGVIRGLQLMATSQHNTYDGLFRVRLETEEESAFDANSNPLGIQRGTFDNFPVRSEPKILEYKFSVDGLMDDFDHEVKFPEHISLVVAWELGTQWREKFVATSLLDPNNVALRQVFGATHLLAHENGTGGFHVIILSDLIDYLRDSQAVVERHQRELQD